MQKLKKPSNLYFRASIRRLQSCARAGYQRGAGAVGDGLRGL